MLSKQDIISYSIFAAIVLVILSTFANNFNLRVIVSFFLMVIIIFWLTNDIYKAICVAFIITLVFYVTQNDVSEGFENKEIKVDEIVKELTDLSQKAAEEKPDEDEDKDSTPLNSVPLNKKEEIQDDDVNLLEDEEKHENTPDLNNKYIESAKAQRETFRLINTIKQLDETVKNLAPTLKEGAGIIEKFRKLNLVQL